jgi:hypothetical protein
VIGRAIFYSAPMWLVAVPTVQAPHVLLFGLSTLSVAPIIQRQGDQ